MDRGDHRLRHTPELAEHTPEELPLQHPVIWCEVAAGLQVRAGAECPIARAAQDDRPHRVVPAQSRARCC